VRKRAISENRFEEHFMPIDSMGKYPQPAWFRDEVQAAIDAGTIHEGQVWSLNDGDGSRVYVNAGFGYSNWVISQYVVTKRPWASYDDYAVWR